MAKNINKIGDPIGKAKNEEEKNITVKSYQVVTVIKLGVLSLDDNKNVTKKLREAKSNELEEGTIVPVYANVNEKDKEKQYR